MAASKSARIAGGRLSRRAFTASGAALGTLAVTGFPAIRARAAEPLKVGTYGGSFKEAFDQHIYPDFTKEIGIPVKSIAEPSDEAWLAKLQAAASDGFAPTDVSIMAQVTRLKGENTQLWVPLDEAKLPGLRNIEPRFVGRYKEGQVNSVGAVSWYITLVSNTNVIKDPPASWKALWEPTNAERLGLLALVGNSFLLDITAKTWFGGTQTLDTEEGLLKAFEKLAELKPNDRLLYRDEGQFLQALRSGEIPIGQYYHDATRLAASKGEPVRSTFPEEGGVLDSGYWCVSKASKALNDAHLFIDYMCSPEVQATLSRKIGAAPTVRRDLLDLTPEEFAAVASDKAPIIPRYDLYAKKSDWLNDKWTQTITG